ncbi:hypothetical protein [Caldicellulosiruptor acetigenus]|uniref:hypothetical protein n=2 Tax=Caldicellulosiruptor acetigenus TaxID=301953 RepID=UPI0012EC50C5|nr:hypothetical protein [Caldicellulosiruptor acetigenus]
MHNERNAVQETEVDLLAVRFPGRKELDMRDHPIFSNQKVQLFIVEGKLNECSFNSATKRNFDEILRRVGFVQDEEAEKVKECLNANGKWEDDKRYIELILVTKNRNNKNRNHINDIGRHLSLKDDILPFIYQRFRQYHEQKKQHRQWPKSGKLLFRLASKLDENAFIEEILLNVVAE